jgi:RHS repeat-associated protein
MRKSLFSVLVLLTLSCVGVAQTNPNLANGLDPYGSYHGGAIDSVSVVNGGLTLHAPIASYPQRGTLSVDFFLTAASKNWQVSSYQQPNNPNPPYLIWATNENIRYGVVLKNSLDIQVRRYRVVSTPNGTINEYTYGPTIVTPDGSEHRLAQLPAGPDSYETIDDTGFSLTFIPGSTDGQGGDDTAVLIDRKGNRYSLSITSATQSQVCPTQVGQRGPNPNCTTHFVDTFDPYTVIDVDGNSMQLRGGLITTDTLGRPLMAVTGDPNCPKWSLPLFGGNTGTITTCYSAYTFQTAFGQPNIAEATVPGGLANINNFTPSLMTSLTLPNTTAWNFAYDQYGDLSSITLPTGGQISYTWQTIPLCQYSGTLTRVSRAVRTRTVSGSGVPTATWTYTFGAPQSDGTMHNVVTDPAGNDTVHVISPIGGSNACSLNETQAVFYQGSQAANSVLKTVRTNYFSTPSAGLGYPDDAEYATNIYPQTVTTTLPNGMVNQSVTTQDSGISSVWSGLPIVLGSIINEKQYDYGQGAPGTLVKQTSTSYTWQSGTNANSAAYLAANILDMPASVTTQDASANRCAETDYTYDESQYLTASGFGSASQHGAAPNAVRGNVTTTTQWLAPLIPSSTSCQLPSGASWSTISTHSNWYDTGELYQAIDALGNPTTHTYDPRLWGAYSTLTTNALGQTIGGVYDFNSGLLTSLTDANHKTSTFFYDNMFRITQANFPDGGQTNFYYTDTPGSLNVQQTRLQIAPSTVVTNTVNFDGLGRKTQAALLDPEGTDVTALAYDPLGRIWKTFNPTRSFNSSTTPYAQTQYDALGRPNQITEQDNGSIVTTYASNCTTVTDEAGFIRRSCKDGLDRLVEVDEPGTPYAGQAAFGSIGISGTLLSQSGIGATGATPATTTIAIGSANPCRQFQVGAQGPQTVCDQGTVWTTINGGHQISTGYITSNSSPNLNTIATNLASAINSDSVAGTIVTATASSSTITITAKTSGASCCNYTVTAGSTSSYNSPGAAVYFNPPGISAGGSSVLANGTNSNPGSTVTDAGTVTVAIGSCSGSVPYSQSGNNSAALVAQALVSTSNPNNLNLKCSGVASAQYAGGSTLTITYGQVGTVGNVSVTAASSSTYPQYFPKGSFGGNGQLQNGANPEGPSLDHNFYVTQYQYDPLGNLICVVQKGTDATPLTSCGAASASWRPRSFQFDSLSRHILSSNPESGQTSYQYDNNGNLIAKTDARGITVNYSPQDSPIDALNRVTKKTYSNGDPAVTYTYDTGANGIGHRTGMTDVAGSTTWTFDPMGRIGSEQRTVNGVPATVGYTYYLDGELKTLKYPSTRTLTYTASYAGRVLSVTDPTNGINFVTGATYAPDGQPTAYTNGSSGSFSGIANAFGYNTRLQMNSMSVASPTQTIFSLGYDFHFGAGDNGNVYQVTNNKDISRNQTFTYDPLNRLASAQNAGIDCSQTVINGLTKYWGSSYSYDLWGNLLAKTPTKCKPESLSQMVDVTNRIFGNGYDATGNMTNIGGASYSFNAEGQVSSTAGNVYVYSGDGERLEKSTTASPVSGTLYWYAAPGVVAETDLTGNPVHEYVFFNGNRIARLDGTQVYYYYSNHLESTSVITDAIGTIQDESDYYPWGGELQIASGLTNPNRYKFTSKEYDPESGNHYFGARYHSSNLGRFISPDDVKYSKPTDPQTWNLYPYVRNGPANRVDFNGHDWFYIHHKWRWQNGHQYTDPTTGKVLSKHGYRYLIVFQKTGTNKAGAATGTLTLFDQKTAVVQSNAFSGGTTPQGDRDAIPNGTYTIDLSKRSVLNSPSQINENTGALVHSGGIQMIPPVNFFPESGPSGTFYAFPGREEWGSMRANLSLNGVSTDKYIHGKDIDRESTHGCICERSEVLLHELLKLDVPQVPVEVK